MECRGNLTTKKEKRKLKENIEVNLEIKLALSFIKLQYYQ